MGAGSLLWVQEGVLLNEVLYSASPSPRLGSDHLCPEVVLVPYGCAPSFIVLCKIVKFFEMWVRGVDHDFSRSQSFSNRQKDSKM